MTSELIADASNAVGAIVLVTDLDWPPRADADGREVHSAIKSNAKG